MFFLMLLAEMAQLGLDAPAVDVLVNTHKWEL
jgi:hypothetical protein